MKSIEAGELDTAATMLQDCHWKYRQPSINNDRLESTATVQTNGVLQGDPLSPKLLDILTNDIVQKITTEEVKILLYADDMVILSKNRAMMQQATNKLEEWSKENDLKINQNKGNKIS